jgi:tetratricopeptide (TPR) repeat protein
MSDCSSIREVPRPPDTSSAPALATEALELVSVDPAAGAALARLVVESDERSKESISQALQALGIAARASGDVSSALAYLQRAVRLAERAGLGARAANARISLAAVLLLVGRTRSALHALDLASVNGNIGDRAHAEVQRIGVLYHLGRHTDALAAAAHALLLLQRTPEQLWEARAWMWRALVEIDLGANRDAEEHLAKAQSLFESAGAHSHAVDVVANRGWCAAAAGRVVDALRHYDDAERLCQAAGLSTAEVILDRSRLLLTLGISDEAAATAQRSVADLAARSEFSQLADAMLTSAECQLANGDAAGALDRADEARREFTRQRRPGWVAVARHVGLRALYRAKGPTPAVLSRATRTADDLAKRGLRSRELDARLVAGQVARHLGRDQIAGVQLEQVATRRRSGPPEMRAHGWLAEALLRLDRADRRGAVSALRAGMRVFDDNRATLGASELRSTISARASEFATLGQRLALESGRPERLLEWTERWRATALRLPPVRPPDDDELAADLARLRRTAADLELAAASGEPTTALERRRASLEEAVRRRARRVSGVAAERDRPPTVAELSAALGDAALLEIAEIDGRLYGVVVADRRSHLVELGVHSAVVNELESARSTLRRLAYRRGSPASLAAAQLGADDAGRCLDELLLDPARQWLRDRPLVVVPPANLHALPWGVVPSCRNRPVTVAPSAAIWLRAATAKPMEGGGVALVAGPDLPGGAEEITLLSSLHPGAIVLMPNEATADATREALDGAALAHVAAHGTFRSDNPLFSALRMADGPLTVYDLERLTQAPHRIVLSACDSGLAGVRAGDELMGLAAALFPLGTAGLVASVVVVPDEATRPLMHRLHERLLMGESLAAALVHARAVDDADPAVYAAGASFVCLGAG